MKLCWILAVLLPLASSDEETCTHVMVIGDEADAECTCTCMCELDCTEPVTSAPPPPPCCYAGKSGPASVDSYDGAKFDLLTNNKFVLSRGGEGTDQCKFQVRVDTKEKDGIIIVDWVGIAFGVHQKNFDKYDRNFRISLNNPVEIRGRGFDDPEPADPDTDYSTEPIPEAPEVWSFMYTNDEEGVFHVIGEVPTLGCSFEVWYWTEAGPVGNDVVKIRPPLMYEAMLEGVCGDWDGAPENDAEHCPTGDCIEGRHQGNDSRD